MEEVVYRRYSRLIDEEESLPQLIVIDGGKGQLNAAVNSLDKLNIGEELQLLELLNDLKRYTSPMTLFLFILIKIQNRLN